MFLGDLISLVFCCGWSETFRHEGYTVTRDGTTVHVQPDPFAGRTIELTALARRMPAGPHTTRGGLQAAYDAAPRVVLRGTARARGESAQSQRGFSRR